MDAPFAVCLRSIAVHAIYVTSRTLNCPCMGPWSLWIASKSSTACRLFHHRLVIPGSPLQILILLGCGEERIGCAFRTGFGWFG